MGPQTAFSDALHAEKYRAEGEDHREAMGRVANDLKDSEEHYEKFRDALREMRFLPGGRIQSAMGSTRLVTAYNCFVSGTIADSFVHDEGNIMQRASEAAATMRLGGGIGYDFSPLRPRNSIIKKLGSRSSGPVSFMDIYDAVCRCIASAGHRRGAQMATLRIDHPDIEEFIHAKQNQTRLTGFNISVAVTDEFMHCLDQGRPFALKWGGEVHREVDPAALWDVLMRSTYDWAEPGVIFIDTINQMNNLQYCETISTTNPCVPGETPILTSAGWKPIVELLEEEVEVWNGEQWSTVTPRVTGHDQSLVTVHLSNGEQLTCTKAHGFVLADGTKVEADDLMNGDELLELTWPVVESGANDESAYTQGCFAGDGWYASNDRPYISFKREDKKKLETYINRVSAYDTKAGYRFLYLKGCVPHVKDFVPGGEWSVKSRLDWLAGLLDTDGTAIWSYNAQGERSSCSAAISSVNKKFMDEVSLLLRTLGVSCNRDVDTRQKEWSKSPACYRIGIKSSNLKKLQALGLETHRVDFTENNPKSTNKVTLKVVGVVPAGVAETVYCFNGVLSSQCGEQPLPPHGACLLGSFNVAKYIRTDGLRRWFDWDQLAFDIPTVVRAMDNVVDRTIYPLPAQQREAESKRRMGIGVTGLANAMEALGWAYGSPDFVKTQEQILKRIMNDTYRASALLAKEKGSFPLYNSGYYLQAPFIKGLQEDVQDLIAQHGIRNSHLTSIAPTGTISLTADNISSGIEPVFEYAFNRRRKTRDGDVVDHIEDYGYRFLDTKGVRSRNVTVDQHLGVLSTAQRYVDSAVSKTCNVPDDVGWEDFKKIYVNAWELGCKGCTTFRQGGKREGILLPTPDEEKGSAGAACYFDTETGRRECE